MAIIQAEAEGPKDKGEVVQSEPDATEVVAAVNEKREEQVPITMATNVTDSIDVLAETVAMDTPSVADEGVKEEEKGDEGGDKPVQQNEAVMDAELVTPAPLPRDEAVLPITETTPPEVQAPPTTSVPPTKESSSAPPTDIGTIPTASPTDNGATPTAPPTDIGTTPTAPPTDNGTTHTMEDTETMPIVNHHCEATSIFGNSLPTDDSGAIIEATPTADDAPPPAAEITKSAEVEDETGGVESEGEKKIEAEDDEGAKVEEGEVMDTGEEAVKEETDKVQEEASAEVNDPTPEGLKGGEGIGEEERSEEKGVGEVKGGAEGVLLEDQPQGKAEVSTTEDRQDLEEESKFPIIQAMSVLWQVTGLPQWTPSHRLKQLKRPYHQKLPLSHYHNWK